MDSSFWFATIVLDGPFLIYLGVSGSLGPVCNILRIFSNANILKNTTAKVSAVGY